MNQNNDKGAELYKAFPKKIQKLVKALVQYENYNEEYLLVSLLSATASAAGNAVRIRIKGEWITHSALYAVLVGSPGMGKTQPMDFAYKPIRRHDRVYLDKYISQMEEYEQRVKNRRNAIVPARPSLRRTLISDFTPEAMIMCHATNLRGITVYADEIMGMLNSANRYNNSPLIEQLLTAYSGKSLDVARVSMDIPLHIEHPCINIIGSMQPMRVKELFFNGYQQNGLLDRFLFSYPLTTKIPFWDKSKASKSTKVYFDEWQKILDRIISLPFDSDEANWKMLPFTKSARDYFFDWHNKNLSDMQKSDMDEAARNRMMKTNLNVARIALAIQLLRWACDEGKDNSVDLTSLKSALQIGEYFEDCYRRIDDFTRVNILNTSARLLYKGLADQFTTAQALRVGKENGMSVRNVKRLLTILAERKLLKKAGHGKYQKLS